MQPPLQRQNTSHPRTFLSRNACVHTDTDSNAATFISNEKGGRCLVGPAQVDHSLARPWACPAPLQIWSSEHPVKNRSDGAATSRDMDPTARWLGKGWRRFHARRRTGKHKSDSHVPSGSKYSPRMNCREGTAPRCACVVSGFERRKPSGQRYRPYSGRLVRFLRGYMVAWGSTRWGQSQRHPDSCDGMGSTFLKEKLETSPHCQPWDLPLFSAMSSNRKSRMRDSGRPMNWKVTSDGWLPITSTAGLSARNSVRFENSTS